ENGRDGLDVFDVEVLVLMGDESDDELGGFFRDNGRQASVGFVFFRHFATVAAAQFAGLEYCGNSGVNAKLAKLEGILAQPRQLAAPAVQRKDVILPQAQEDRQARHGELELFEKRL